MSDSQQVNDLGSAPVAYFCAEFGIDVRLPLYAGGLGVLAGDHCKAASDLGVPLVAVGLLYTHGAFAQHIASDGWQHAVDPAFDVLAAPLQRCQMDDRSPRLVHVQVAGRSVAIGAWEHRLNTGDSAGPSEFGARLLLLDTHLEVNHPDDRRITDRLYGGGAEHRLRQEWVLGVGGVRMLRALGIAPAVWHANEGHAAFMMIERVREGLSRDPRSGSAATASPTGAALTSAIEQVRATTVFTTHTPVPAGHDVFDTAMLDRVCGLLAASPPIERRAFHALGRHPETGPEAFHMTAAAMRLSGFINGVSQVHADVAREQWHDLWPDKTEAQVPIAAITNGVHVDSWLDRRIAELIAAELGSDWRQRAPDEVEWARILEVDDEALWRIHESLRAGLLEHCREVSRRRWHLGEAGNSHLASGGALLGPRPLTLGFARRFATYKRADLLLRDGERLERLLCNRERPVQLVVAGKAHPADHGGLLVLQRLWRASRDPRFGGRIAFLENYDMTLARCLVQGVDVWLNLPRVPLEACGTSGMKAALNGVPQLGTLDGWWAEGFTGKNGWALPRRSAEGPESDDEVDEADHAALFDLLEQKVVPLFFKRDGATGVPHEWVNVMKHAMREAVERFSAARMMRDYLRLAYSPAYRSASTLKPGNDS